MGEAVGGGEIGGEEAIDTDFGLAAGHEDFQPTNDADGGEAQPRGDHSEPGAVDSVVGFRKVGVEKPCREAEFTKACCNAEVVPDVVGDIPAREES